jgi:glutamyl-tRNA reductase
MNIFVAGLSYKTAPVEVREQVAVSPSKLWCVGCRLKINAGLSEVVLLSTCNRVEIYGVAEKINGSVKSILNHLTASGLDLDSHTYFHQGAEAIRHLLSVTSGLDSMVLGETEINGQVKQAYEAAKGVRLTGSVLNRVFQKAFQTAKEIRTRTSIGRGATSVGSVAVELAEKIFGTQLKEKTIMIIGAGKMGEACIRHLAKKGSRTVLVSNRSYDRAAGLAAEFGGKAIRFDECVSAMAEADIVVSSTGCPQTILHRAELEQVMRSRRNRPLALIDIAVPRDIDPEVQKLENVYLYDIDDLQSLVQENVRLREQELDRCRTMVNDNTQELLARFGAQERREPAATPEWKPAWGFSGAMPAGA